VCNVFALVSSFCNCNLLPELKKEWVKISQLVKWLLCCDEVDNQSLIPTKGRDLSLHCIHTSSEAHSSSYPVSAGCSLCGDGMVRVWTSPLMSILCQDAKFSGASFVSPINLHGIVHRHRVSFTFVL
jgi:hypothetical protein